MRRAISLSLGLLVLAALFLPLDHSRAADFPVITAPQLKAKLDAGEKLMLLNPLSDIEFSERHIPGSINIPLHEIMTTNKLPKEKNTLIITYCLGPR